MKVFLNIRICFSLLSVLLTVLNCNEKTTKQPNILIILTDDQGYGDIGINGNPEVDTPNMDAFARQSVQLHDYHAQPVCAPSRAQLMTGRPALEVGVWGVHAGRDYLNLDETTIAEVLHQNNFPTYMIGKWHLGKEDPYLPEMRGFDEAWVQRNLYAHQNPEVKHKGELLTPKGWTVDYFTDKAIEIMTSNTNTPKFLYLGYPQIHKPYVAPDSLIQKYIDRGHPRSVASIYGITEQLDQNLGRLFSALEESGQMENTLIFFIGDNGPIWNNAPENNTGIPQLPEAEKARNPMNFSGVKGRLRENGHRTIGFIKYGNRYTPHIESQMVDIADVFPTVLDVLNISMPDSSKPLYGQSIVPVLEGIKVQRDQYLYYANHEVLWQERPYQYAFLGDKNRLKFEEQELAIRKGKYKYVQGYFGKKLYDLEADVQETKDLSDELPELRTELENQLKKWWEIEVVQQSNSYDMPEFYLGIGIRDDSTYIHGEAPFEVFGDIVTTSHSTDNWTIDGDGQSFKIHVDKFGIYEFKMDFKEGEGKGEIQVVLDGTRSSYPVERLRSIPLLSKPLEPGEYTIEIRLIKVKNSGKPVIENFYGLKVKKVAG